MINTTTQENARVYGFLKLVMYLRVFKRIFSKGGKSPLKIKTCPHLKINKGFEMKTKKNNTELSNKEWEKLTDKLNQIELELRQSWGLNKISGGFVRAEFLDADDEKIYIEIKDGVQSDCQNTVNTEEVSLWRNNLEYTD